MKKFLILLGCLLTGYFRLNAQLFRVGITKRIMPPNPLLAVSGGIAPSNPLRGKKGALAVPVLVFENNNARVAIVGIDNLAGGQLPGPINREH